MSDGGYSPLLGLSQRAPPSNIAAEQSLLGALMANNKAYERVCEFLHAEHFIDPMHGRIYDAIEQRILENRLADGVTLRQDFENTGILDELGGTAYLAELLSAMVSIVSAGEYGRSVYDAWLRRELISVGETIVNNAFAYDRTLDAVAQIEWAERALTDIRADGVRRDRLMSLGEAVALAIRAADKAYKSGRSAALTVGFGPFDRAMGGLWPGDFTLLGGVPGAGKTALAMQLGCSIAQGIFDESIAAGAKPEDAIRLPGVAMFSLEMSAEELGARVASARAAISVERLRQGRLDLQIADKLLFVEQSVANLPMRIHDCRATSLKMLGAKMRMHLRRQPECLAIVDHLLVADTTDKKSRGNDVQSVSVAAREMKMLAGDTGLPLLVLTHVGRSTAQRVNPRPGMGDVKWAGEADADNVTFVHRPVMFMSHDAPAKVGNESEEKHARRCLAAQADYERHKDLAEFVVAKRRMGATGVERMRFNGATTSFSEWSEPQ